MISTCDSAFQAALWTGLVPEPALRVQAQFDSLLRRFREKSVLHFIADSGQPYAGTKR